LADGRDLDVFECPTGDPCHARIGVVAGGSPTAEIAGHIWFHWDVDDHYQLYTTFQDGMLVRLTVPRGENDDADLGLLTEIARTLR